MLDLISVGVISTDIAINLPFLPEDNSECFIKSINKFHGGAAANVAAYSSFYGDLTVGLASKVGGDKEGEELLQRLKEYRVDLDGVVIQRGSKSSKIFALNYSGDNRNYLVNLGAINNFSIDDIPDKYLEDSKLLYLAPCTKKVHKQLIKFGLENNKVLAFNPGTVYFEQESFNDLRDLLKSIDFLFVNEIEALNYARTNTIKEAGERFALAGVKCSIITKSNLGCEVFYMGDNFLYPGIKTKVKNSIGAGDAFAAGFLSDFLKTSDIESAAKTGNIFGAFKLKSVELRTPNPDKESFLDFLNKMKKEISTGSGIDM